MINTSTLAQLAENSYSSSGLPNFPTGWSPIGQSTQMQSGFTGNAFYQASSNTLVIGYGGTSDNADKRTGAQLAVAGSSTQESEAVSYANGVINQFNSDVASGLYVSSGPVNIVYTGHSLGGVLAQRAYLGDDNGNAQAVVFNAPGLGGFWGNPGISSNGVQYYYSDPATWDQPSGPGLGSLVTSGNVHNLGDLLNDNVYFILGAQGHSQASILTALQQNGEIPVSADQWGAILAEQVRSGERSISELLTMVETAQEVFRDVVFKAIRDSGVGCFAAGTMITKADGTKKSIENIVPGDWVISYNGLGRLTPGRVTATQSHEVKHLLNVFGLMVTPGHVALCGDGKFTNKHVPIIDILRSDCALVKEDGTLIRATTNIPVGDPRDGFVKAITGTSKANGYVDPKVTGRIRLGTRFIVSEGHGHKSFSVYDLISAAGGVVGNDEMIRIDGGEPMPFHWEFGDTLPKPEDFVLACSGTSLEDIYKAAEWENHAPRLPAPVSLDGKPVRPSAGLNLKEMAPNVTLKVKHVSASVKES